MKQFKKIVFYFLSSLNIILILNSSPSLADLTKKQQQFLQAITDAANTLEKNIQQFPYQTTDEISLAIRDQLAFLPKPKEVDVLQLAQEIAQEFKSNTPFEMDDPSNHHHPFFASYARILLDLVRRFSLTSSQVCLLKTDDHKIYDSVIHNKEYYRINEKIMSYLINRRINNRKRTHPDCDSNAKILLNTFEEEITENENSHSASYEWFILFVDRLSFFADPEFNIGVTYTVGFNTGYTQYKTALSEHISTPDRYKSILRNGGDQFTRKMSSPLALTRLFPEIVMLPFPFALTQEDILFQFPDKTRNLWPLGFALTSVKADQYVHTPYYFYTHDYHHLAILRAGMSSIGLSFQSDKFDKTQVNAKELKKWLNDGKELFLESVTELSKKISLLQEQGEQRKVFVAFLFSISHEYVVHLYDRLESLLPGNQGLITLHFNKKTSESYPYSVLGRKSPTQSEAYIKNFHKFIELTLGPEKIEQIRNWLGAFERYAGFNFYRPTVLGRFTHDMDSLFVFPWFHTYAAESQVSAGNQPDVITNASILNITMPYLFSEPPHGFVIYNFPDLIRSREKQNQYENKCEYEFEREREFQREREFERETFTDIFKPKNSGVIFGPFFDALYKGARCEIL